MHKSRALYGSGFLHYSLMCLFASLGRTLAADFTVTTPTFAFTINDVETPTLTLERGRTYTFAVNTACGFHPFRINSPGTVNNPACSGTLTYTVPMAAMNYTYDCAVHGHSCKVASSRLNRHRRQRHRPSKSSACP